MSEQRVAAWMALLDSGLSPLLLARLAEAFGSPEAALDTSDARWAAEAGLRPEQCQRLRESARDNLRRKRQVELFHQHGMRLLEMGDAEYPERLREVKAPPPVLFARGATDPDDRLAVALVGPRMATPYGLEVTRRLATEFAPLMTVVSGLALGIDTAAHEATLRAGGRTIGVAACSLDQDYPKGNEPLRQRMAGEGLLLSAYAPLTKAATHHFPNRNHVMAGMVMAVIVIEASEKSGALLTASAALEAGREVFAVPGDITRRNSRGTNTLLAQGAGVCTGAQDVIAALGEHLEAELEAMKRRRAAESGNGDGAENAAPAGLSPAEAAVLDFIRHTQRQYDDLLASFVPGQMTLGELTTALLQLELRGLVRQQPGKIFIPG